MHQFNDSAPVSSLGGGVTRKVLSHSPNLMAAEFHFDQGSIGVLHAHPHEQIGYVVSGRLRLTVDTKTVILGAGDTYYIAPYQKHGVEALEETLLLDVFTPQRDDFL